MTQYISCHKCNNNGKNSNTCHCNDRIYPCADCGTMRTLNEGGTIFTVCDECWDKHFTKDESTRN